MTDIAPLGSGNWPKTSRNEPCPCGSGQKYKRCCGANTAAANASRSDPQAARLHFQRGVQALKARRPSDAVPFLNDAIRSDPNFFEAHHALGSALLQLGRFADASQILLRALALRPDFRARLAGYCDVLRSAKPARAGDRGLSPGAGARAAIGRLASSAGATLHRL